MSNPSKKLTKKEKFQHTQLNPTVKKQTVSAEFSFTKFYLLIAIVAFALYANTLSNYYVLDDFSVIKENNIVNQGTKNLGQIFKTSYRAGYLNVNDGLYRPLSLAMFAIEWSISPNNAALGHFINILFYALCGIVLLKVLSKVLPTYHPYFLTGIVLLFIAHPIHTEVVGNVKSRDELLCFLFSFLFVNQVWNYLQKAKFHYLISAAVCLFIAFLAKESAILILPILVALLYFFHPNKINNAIGITAASAIPFALYMLIRKSVLGTFAGIQTVALIDNPIGVEKNIFVKFMGSMGVLGDYFKLFALPHPLVYDYSFNSTPLHGFTFWSMSGLLIVIAMIVAAIYFFKRNKLVAFSIVYMAIAISLYTNLVFTIGAAKAERFTFLASLGFCILLALIIAKLAKLNILKNNTEKANYKHYTLGIATICVLYSVKTISRNTDWKDNLTLYEHDVALNPESSKTHYYLGNELIKITAEAEPDTAKKMAIFQRGIDEVRKAIEIYPQYSDGYTQIGVGFFKMNQMDSAGYYFNEGLKYNPNNSVALSNLGAYYFNKQRYSEAIEIYKRALTLNPRYIDAMLNLGSCYGASGQFKDAVVWFGNAINLDPNNQKAINLMVVTYQNMGQMEQAKYYQSLLKR